MKLVSLATAVVVWGVFQFVATWMEVWAQLAPEHRSARNMAAQCAESLKQTLSTPVECRRAAERTGRWLVGDVFVRTVRETPWCFGWTCARFFEESSWSARAFVVASFFFAYFRPRLVDSARRTLENGISRRRKPLILDD